MTTTSRSVYGPTNPYDVKAIADAFCRQGIGSVLQSRTGTESITPCYQAEIDNDVPLEYIAHHEIEGSIAALVNSALAAFWTLLLLYFHPGLLDDNRNRNEVDACTETSTADGPNIKPPDTATLK
ncbi:hypothetical protein GGR53DRAFT_462944 [Hypoxylon sp. FL1150]|nr:hypothetical protein GGR53DRAFT_462944 [Hypoxylon sp. FL1150]